MKPKTQPIHTCCETCECDGCEKIRKDKTVNPKIGGSKTIKSSQTPPASRKFNIMKYEKGFYDRGKIAGRKEALDKVAKFVNIPLLIRKRDLIEYIEELKGGSDE